MALSEAIGESLNGELAASKTKSNRVGQLFDIVRAKMADFQERMDERVAVIRSIIEHS